MDSILRTVMDSGLSDRADGPGVRIQIGVGLYPAAREPLPAHIFVQVIGEAPLIGIAPKALFRLSAPSHLLEHRSGDMWGVAVVLTAEDVVGANRVLTLETVASVSRAAHGVILKSLGPYFLGEHRPPTEDMIASQIIQEVVASLPSSKCAGNADH